MNKNIEIFIGMTRDTKSTVVPIKIFQSKELKQIHFIIAKKP